jgi:YugN-like family
MYSFKYSLQLPQFSTIIKFEKILFHYLLSTDCFLGGTCMKFENTGLEGLRADLNYLDDVLPRFGLIREGQWDYERVTYDRKFELKEGTFYLRVFGFAVEGDVGAHKATIQLMTPLLGKHYYPHGVEYGENENFPKSLVNQCEKILADVKAEIEKVAIS